LKFFLFKNKSVLCNNTIRNSIEKNSLLNSKLQINILENFNGILIKCGYSTKYKLILIKILIKINFFFINNKDFLYLNYDNVRWIFDNIFEKKLSYQIIFNDLVGLLKPPFVVKSLLVSKKLKKKLKIKYTIKIVYKKDDKRIKNSLKQLYYNNGNFNDNKFCIRLYKSLLITLLDWKQSNLFKFKNMVFKNFFKS
jgi:hypothetical protein